MVVAAAAGICFYFSGRFVWLLAVAPLLCYLRLWLNMLDGMVALAGGTASVRGELLNDLPDRVSDILIFIGVAQSGLCAPASGYGAAIMALLAAYVGMTGQALAGRREYGGVMSKPWRMVALQCGAYLALGLRLAAVGPWRGPTVLDWTCLMIMLGCLQTIFIRLRHILAAPQLRKTSAPAASVKGGRDDQQNA